MSDFTERSLKELFSKYKIETTSAKQNEFVELEIRLKDINRDAFEAIYSHALSNPEFTNRSLEMSVNVISENVYEKSGSNVKSDETSYIRKIVFVKGNASGDTYYKKVRLMRSVVVSDYTNYSVGLSKEISSGKFPISPNALIRFKARVSFNYSPNGESPRWRFDLTAVRRGNMNDMNTGNLKEIKQKLFTPTLTPENFLRDLNYEMIDEFEVEIEYIGENKVLVPADLSIVKKAFSMINSQYLSTIAYQEEIFNVAKLIAPDPNKFKQPGMGIKQLLNQAISLTKSSYYIEVFPADGYLLTIKADGERACVVINGNRYRVLSSALSEYLAGPDFVPGNNITICDCEIMTAGKELVIKEGGVIDGPFFLRVFDVIMSNGESVFGFGLEKRKDYIDDAVAKLNAISPDSARPAKYTVLDAKNLEAGFRAVWDVKYDHIVDGMILSRPSNTYMETKNYKWKPYDNNTIDFLAIKCPQKLLGIKPYEVRKDYDLYLLFVGINHTVRTKLGMGFIPQYRHIFTEDYQSGQYYPIQFSPSSNPLAYLYYHPADHPIDRKIVELGRNQENTQWVFHRVREDRKVSKNYFGNDFKTAELTYSNFIDPITFENLWKPSDSYFTKTASTIHSAPNIYKRFVISTLLKNNLSGAKWIIDEAAGRGGDLHRYQEIGVENGLFIDIQPTAIAELISRKFSLVAAKKQKVRHWMGKTGGSQIVVAAYDRIHDIEYDKLITKDVKSLTVHTLVADLKTPHADLIAKTFQFGLNPGLVDGIVCNFAFHYMCDTIENMRNLLLFNSKMLKQGGLFIMTVMDGEAVFDLLKDIPTGQSWETNEDGVPKYTLRKDYRGDKLAKTGQMISVRLPFVDDLVQEPLANIDVITSEASKLGLEIELNSPMGTMMKQFESQDRHLFNQLTPDDKKYIDLYRYITMRKVK